MDWAPQERTRCWKPSSPRASGSALEPPLLLGGGIWRSDWRSNKGHVASGPYCFPHGSRFGSYCWTSVPRRPIPELSCSALIPWTDAPPKGEGLDVEQSGQTHSNRARAAEQEEEQYGNSGGAPGRGPPFLLGVPWLKACLQHSGLGCHGDCTRPQNGGTRLLVFLRVRCWFGVSCWLGGTLFQSLLFEISPPLGI